MTKCDQLNEAKTLAVLAFKSGVPRAPFMNAHLMQMMQHRSPGETPKGEASTTDILKAYVRAWDDENLAPISHLLMECK